MVTCFLHYRRTVCLAIQDEAWRFGRYYKYVLRRLHINTRRVRLSYRSSLAVIGYVGRRRPRWVRSMSRPQRRGPSYVSARIPVYGGEGTERYCLRLLVSTPKTCSLMMQYFIAVEQSRLVIV